MNLRLRPLLLATGALLLTAASASAQFIELVTEAPVTLQVTLTTTTTTITATERKNTATISRLANKQVLEELCAASIIPDSVANATNWSLVAVNYAPADLAHVNAAIYLYAIKGNTRIAIPESKFSAAAFGSAEKYKERHLGRYILESSGTVTNHVSYNYLPALDITPTGGAATHFTLTDSTTDGFASIAYKTKDAADGYEVFFYAISSLRATSRGSFIALLGTGPATTQGLISLTFTLGAAKLVPATLYPNVPIFPGVSSTPVAP